MERAPKRRVLTERDIQIALYYWVLRKGQQFIVPNINLFSWESDLISVTNAGFVYEYEIKLTRADFKKDFEKKSKHKVLQRILRPARGSPNYFSYVCPEGLLSIEEVPAYAGLIEIRPYNRWHSHYWVKRVVKKAPRLHKEKLPVERLIAISSRLLWRMWHYMIEYRTYELKEDKKHLTPGGK